jgi:hypothetical protein
MESTGKDGPIKYSLLFLYVSEIMYVNMICNLCFSENVRHYFHNFDRKYIKNSNMASVSLRNSERGGGFFFFKLYLKENIWIVLGEIRM